MVREYTLAIGSPVNCPFRNKINHVCNHPEQTDKLTCLRIDEVVSKDGEIYYILLFPSECKLERKNNDND